METVVRAGSYLVVVHGVEEDVARAQQTLTEAGSTDVRRHDKHRGAADQIDRVEADAVHLSVTDTGLLREL